MTDDAGAPVDGRVMVQESAIHGRGAFARGPIPPETPLMEYVGERISTGESLRRCERGHAFIFALDADWHLDGDVAWNPARYLNHSCRPNCEARCFAGGVWIVTSRAVAAGEELTFDYGYDLEAYREHPCHCGAPDCVGFIVAAEFHLSLRRQAEARSEG
jgi:SET domain-containing protein